MGAYEDAGLRLFASPPRYDVLGLHLALVRLDGQALLDGRELLHERVLRRQDEVGCAKHRIGPGCEDRDLLAARRLEDELGTFAPADPVLLKKDGGGRPVEVVEVLEQPLGIVRNAKEPLVQEPLFDGCVTPLATSID